MSILLIEYLLLSSKKILQEVVAIKVNIQHKSVIWHILLILCHLTWMRLNEGQFYFGLLAD